MKTKYKAILLSAVSALLFPTSALATLAADRAYESGLEAAKDYRYSEALMHFQLAAEEGNRDAQRTIGLMLLYGERLYDADIQQNHEQAMHWLKSASEKGCETSTFMLQKLALQSK